MEQAPDYEHAALKAAETLIQYRVSFAPVDPLVILKSLPGVLVYSFAEIATDMGIDRKSVIGFFGSHGKDAATSVMAVNGKTKYLVGYNQRLPFYLSQRALARELGHIILGHDGSRPEDVRTAEAVFFAQHFLCPRPLIRLLQDSGVHLTAEVIGNVTGCYERCMARMRNSPGVYVPAALNRLIREQFSDYVQNFADVQAVFQNDDDSTLADFGTFMDQYKE